MKKSKLSVIDLFCGCGGLSYGFMNAGYDVLLGIDNDQASLETFKANHPESITSDLDLFDKDSINKIKKIVGNREIDVIMGGPPCQGFSLTGTRNFDDKRNGLYLTLLETVKILRPKAFIIENVPGMATLYGGTVRDEIIRRCKKMGYNVSYKVLLAADYGVPQMRKRLVFVGIKPEFGQFEFPEPVRDPGNYITCSAAIGDLPSREEDLGKEEDVYSKPAKTPYQNEMRRKSLTLFNHTATAHTEVVKKVISLVPEGGNYKDLPPGIGTHRKFNEAWTRYHGNKPSKTIDTGHRNHFHYKYNRVPTVRENARLQSFPDTFRFYGTRTEQYRQVGNAVPPLLAYNLGKKLLSYLSKTDEKNKIKKSVK